MRKKSILIIISFGIMSLFTVTGSFASPGNIIIVCNKSISDNELNKDEIRDIFLGKKTKWSDGKKIIFLTQQNKDVHEEFLRIYIGRTPFQYGNYWKNQVFTGKGKMPLVFANDQDLIRFVNANEGAIGYISTGSQTEPIKTIKFRK